MKLDKKIPQKGVDRQELLDTLQTMKSEDGDWRSGKVWSLVYHGGEEHLQLLKDAYCTYISENFLNPMVFKSLKKMEAEVVGMTANMLNGDENAVGTMTSGGTESILLAVAAYRDRARRMKPWIRRPEVLGPASLHPAFRKAAHYFNVKLVEIPLNADFTVDIHALRRRINRNTIMIAASAPQYPQGVIDPIEEIGALAQKHKIPFHVDSCIGGFMLPWLDKLGHPIPPFDFRVPGVTSISADIHKYGYASKGASVVVYRSMDYLKFQFFVSTKWLGGIYASPTMQGTKSGGAIAAAWTAMRSLGKEGYLKMAKETLEATKRYIAGIESIPELYVLGKPQMTLVAYGSKRQDIDIYAVADQLEKKGWHLDRQQNPNSIHATITHNHTKIIDQYFADVREAVDYVKKHPGLASEGNAAMYGMMAKIPKAFQGMVDFAVQKVMEGMYGPKGEAPDFSKLGEGDDADPVFKLINKYGDKAMQFIDKFQDSTKKIKKQFKSTFTNCKY
jgi:glutamate/tyrosine decarboxylase-like PLP-dependent enzyme